MTHLVDGPVEMDGGLLLRVDGDDVGAGLGKVGYAELGLDNHLSVDEGVRGRPEWDMGRFVA